MEEKKRKITSRKEKERMMTSEIKMRAKKNRMKRKKFQRRG